MFTFPFFALSLLDILMIGRIQKKDQLLKKLLLHNWIGFDLLALVLALSLVVTSVVLEFDFVAPSNKYVSNRQ